MNREELKEKMDNAGILPSEYSIYGHLVTDALILDKMENYWEVFVWDRGIKDKLKTFTTEHEACTYVYNYFITLYSHFSKERIEYFKSIIKKK